MPARAFASARLRYAWRLFLRGSLPFTVVLQATDGQEGAWFLALFWRGGPPGAARSVAQPEHPEAAG
eukprot:3623295-Lingulodinium_polyedra.AAC.1